MPAAEGEGGPATWQGANKKNTHFSPQVDSGFLLTPQKGKSHASLGCTLGGQEREQKLPGNAGNI